MIENKEKINAYLCDRRHFALNNKNNDCLIIARYDSGFIAWIHGKLVYDYSFPAYKDGVFSCEISNEDIYRLGNLYYDFFEGLKKLGMKFDEQREV